MCVVAGGNDDMIQYQKTFYGQSVMSKDDVNRRHNNQIIYSGGIRSGAAAYNIDGGDRSIPSEFSSCRRTYTKTHKRKQKYL